VELDAAGVLLLAFPLLPPAARSDAARRAKALAARGAELALPLDAGLPVVAAQGERDTFGSAADLAGAAPRLEVHAVAAADHSFSVPTGGPSPRAALLQAALAAVRQAAGE
jgi:predicted alpha/beta-hydrolase family hydrolase